MEIHSLETEQNNPNTLTISESSTIEMLHMINEEDKKVALAVENVIPVIAEAVDAAAERLKKGGRMFYFGAGTSGRLGVIDASEVRCTYGLTNVQAIIAGGETAVFDAAKGAEDDNQAGEAEVVDKTMGALDIVVGIAASGRTPYVLGALKKAKENCCLTIGICNNPDSEMSRLADFCIAPATGAEAVEGSTRMKAGTAQKMVLNMLSTGIMIKLGRVYQNRMIYMTPNNEKLFKRSVRIVMDCTAAEEETVKKALEACDWSLSKAIVMLQFRCTLERAQELLSEYDGNISEMRKAYGLFDRN